MASSPSECLVCCSSFSSSPTSLVPRSLPCGHTLCTKCVGALIVRGFVCCPVCRNTTVLRTATDLPTNFSLLHMIEVGAGAVLAGPKAAPTLLRFVNLPPPRIIAAHGCQPGQVQRPRGMCANSATSVIVCDKEERQLLEVFVDGRPAQVLPQPAFQTFFGLFRDKTEPYHVAIDRASGDYLIVDVGLHRVLRLHDGQMVWAFGSKGVGGSHFDSPRDVKMLGDGRAVVADCGNGRLLLVDVRTGKSVGVIEPIPAVGLRWPAALAVDTNGLIYVSDNGNDRVVVVDSEGHVERIMGTRGSGPGQLQGPEGVVVGADGVVYVADGGNDRVVVFYPDGTSEHFPVPTRPVMLALLPGALVVACHGEVVVFDHFPSE